MFGAIESVVVVKYLMDPPLPLEPNDPDRLDPCLGPGDPLGVELLNPNSFGEEVQLHCLYVG